MSQDVSETGNAGVDPRWARSRAATVSAAAALLEREGPSAVTHQRVANEACVARATVYRHWPRIERLLLEVMAAAELPFFGDPSLPLRGWLRSRLRELADELALPAVQATTLTLMQGAVWDRDIATRRDLLVGTVTEHLATAFTLAHRAGELPHPPDAADAAARLVGPLLYRTALQAGTVSPAMIEDLIDQVLGRSRDA